MKKLIFFLVVFMSAFGLSVYSITLEVIDYFNNPESFISNIDNNQDTPIATVIEQEVTCQYLSEYDVYSNVLCDEGAIKTFTQEKTDEANTWNITVTITNDSGVSTDVSFTLKETKTEDKKIFVLGDSIVRGFIANDYSFANYLENENFGEVEKCGNNDFRLSTYDDPDKWLVDAAKKYVDDETYNFDYIVLEGGINDVFYDTPLGEYEDEDEKTFTGGLRIYLDTITQRWPNSRIGYLITYYPLNYSEAGKTWSEEDYQLYHDRMIEVLKEYDIDYLDLSEEKYMDMLKAGETTYLEDYLHPNAEAHEIIAKLVFEWVEGLKKYEG